LKPEDFENYLTKDIGFTLMTKSHTEAYETKKKIKGFDLRCIQIYKK
jgi:hypothetical protein